MYLKNKILQQLKTHMQTLDELHRQVCPSEQEKCAALTLAVRCDVQKAIEEYGMVQSRIVSDSTPQYDDADKNFDELATVSDKSVLIPREEEAVQSWEELRKVKLCNI